MAFFKTVAALQILLLVVNTFSAHAAAPAPITKKYPIAVEGVIYCKSCKLPGYVKSLKASPLPGAVAKLQCKVGPKGLVLTGTADENGYFLIQAADVSNYAADYCKVVLGSSPLPQCKKPSNFNNGTIGAALQFERITMFGTTEAVLYSVGLLVFAPTNKTSCP